MAFINKNKAKVGDYVKVIKKLPYKDQMGVEIGDVGVVNYIASTGKYSVHIDGKKNPHDDSSQRTRSFGKKYDFWIPFSCCEVVDLKFKIDDKVRINYPQATKIHNCTGKIIGVKYCFDNLTSYIVEIVNTDSKTIKTILFENRLEKIVNISEELTRQCLFENADALDNYKVTCTINAGDISFADTSYINTTSFKGTISYYNDYKESEENKMKEIKNQKVVDLHFERKKKLIDNAYIEDVKAAEKIDPNRVFVEELKKQFNDYVEANVDNKNEKLSFDISLPLTEGCSKTIAEIKRQYIDNKTQLEEDKEEILAMLYGCETYEQELVVLRSYGIVSDNKMVSLETN